METEGQSSDPEAPIRVMLVDDHVFWRRGVKQIIDEQPDMEVVAEASNGEEAVSRATSVRPEIILMDVNMPKMSGVQATRA
ncbi:MAG TPA: DNA-binding response regulator, partial [Chloroflexi bacterium]|nr:DNA-binding response regulator [Chloroflexota bacterium]